MIFGCLFEARFSFWYWETPGWMFLPWKRCLHSNKKNRSEKSKCTNKIISGDAKYSKGNTASRLHKLGSSMLNSHGQHGGREGGKRPVQGVGVCAESGMAVKSSQRTKGRKSSWKERHVQRCNLVLGFVNSKLIR